MCYNKLCIFKYINKYKNEILLKLISDDLFIHLNLKSRLNFQHFSFPANFCLNLGFRTSYTYDILQVRSSTRIKLKLTVAGLKFLTRSSDLSCDF